MARDYSGLDVRSALGGADLGLDGTGQAVGSLWSGAEIAQIDQSFSQLRRGEQVDYAELDQVTQLVQRGLHHPTYAMNSQELIEGIYHLSPTAEGQAHVVGNLLNPGNVGLLRDLLTTPEDTNHLAERLGPQGIQRLLDIATTSNPIARITSLFGWARHAVSPKSYLGTGESEGQVQPSDLYGVDTEFATAILENDIRTVEAKIAQTEDLTALARETVGLLGEQARPVLQQLAMGPDAQSREFAFRGLQFLTELNLYQEQPAPAENTVTDFDVQPGGGQSVGAVIDATALESLLSAPDSLPASLAARFGCSPAVQACLFELIVRD